MNPQIFANVKEIKKKQAKDNPEILEPSIYNDRNEILYRIQGQLFGALAMLDTLQDGEIF
ncbi:unnamed protein product [Dracunculus medinensis]|uniref:CRISPR type III-B/RAMP module-associated protein Cmr5 n=1 Tax=Dracunculus medinensis TaxID=318479 RepID=A0A0N4UH09_DRAME|nr:unnamed protein product [Dracunculus medinensis]